MTILNLRYIRTGNKERLQKDIAILYDDKATDSFRKGRLFLEYNDKNRSRPKSASFNFVRLR